MKVSAIIFIVTNLSKELNSPSCKMSHWPTLPLLYALIASTCSRNPLITATFNGLVSLRVTFLFLWFGPRLQPLHVTLATLPGFPKENV